MQIKDLKRTPETPTEVQNACKNSVSHAPK